MSSIFVAVPSYRGISEDEAKERCAEKSMVAAGHTVGLAVLCGCALLDFARAELVAAFMQSQMELLLCMDDDLSIDGASILAMLELMSGRGPAGAPSCRVLCAPYRLRSGTCNFFSILPTSAPDAYRLAECLWTGLGCVLMTRAVVEILYAKNARLCFPSEIAPGHAAVGVFNSMVVDAAQYSGASGAGLFLGDDRAFSHRLRLAGITIHAYVDARTTHRGLDGCLGEALRTQDAVARKRGEASVEPLGLLVDASGRPL